MCNCHPEKVEYPQTDEWGSLTWSIMHSLSLKAGSVSNTLLREDEIRAWALLLPALGLMIPCPDCREHFATWILNRPIKPMLSLSYSEKAEWIRIWLYDLHSSVNARLGKTNLPYENLRATYNSFNVVEGLQQLDPILVRAIKLGGASLLKYNEWKKQMSMLRGLY